VRYADCVTTARRLHYSYDDYLRVLDQSDFKLEYCDGVIYAMAGGTIAHAALSGSIIGVLRQVAGKGCLVFSSDLKVRVEATDLSTFPDAAVVRGPAQPAAIDAHALTNPLLLVEVTSRSTEDYDRGDKLSHYKQLSSLQAVVFVSHRAKAITVVQRTDTGWQEREFRSGEVAQAAGLSFAVDEVYQGITLEPKAS
jgi:Uma2 family endonuclease